MEMSLGETTTWNVSKTVSAALAAAIVAAGALALDRGHLAAAPAGIVEIGQLAPVEAPVSTAAMRA